MSTLNGACEKTAVLHWDAVRGLVGVNEAGKRQALAVLGEAEGTSVGPEMALVIAEKLKEDAILFLANAHRYYGDADVVQGIWNLRDPYKARGCTLILMTALSADADGESFAVRFFVDFEHGADAGAVHRDGLLGKDVLARFHRGLEKRRPEAGRRG
jgi:hypothetical protein